MCAIVPRNLGSYSYAGTNYANPHAVTSIGGTTYAYDNNGNVTSIGSLDYTWDWRNRLASAERSAGGITTYSYDHTGQRVLQATGSATTTYPNRYYNVASSSLTATTKHIFSPNGTLLATVVSSGVNATTTYLHPDHLGGTNVVTDANGDVVQTLDYYPYGSQRIATGSFDEQRRFIGEEYDADTEFSYLNARYYQGSRGQFMSQDPVFINLGVDKRTKIVLLDPQQQNAYAYSRNNPLAFKDATGEIAFLAVPAAPVIWRWISAGFTAMALIKTVESGYENLWLPFVAQPGAYNDDERAQTPIRFGVESALNWGSRGLPTVEGRVLLDSVLWGAEHVPGNQEEQRKRSARVTVSSGGNYGGSSGAVSGTYTYQIPSKPTVGPSRSAGQNSISLSGAQQSALQSFSSAINSQKFDAQAFISSLQSIIKAFELK